MRSHEPLVTAKHTTVSLYVFNCLHNLPLFQIILGHENSEPCVTQLRAQLPQTLSAFQAHVTWLYFGLLIGNSVAYVLRLSQLADTR